ncbi:sugar transferase [Blastococcus sp. CT_GayMR16]|uniref:sugar transferase n=1 Tax=Blastococcus sp. CT_GayMR16 TaxID=2559607 RepID=UPI0010738BF0|nr:sugar transferase [Blastococcus sp. CT_GayMR16]TFV90369.1 sugar transferase [Blastococcus sp. CT_GayMR16]
MSQAKYSEHVLPVRGAPSHPPSFGHRLRGSGTVARRAWRDAYVRRLVVVDAGCALVAGAVGRLAGLGPVHPWTAALPLGLFVALPLVWVLAMHAMRSYEQQFLWEGLEEFRRVLFAGALVLAGVAIASWGLELPIDRGFVVVALLLATALTLASRLVQREWLRRQRAKGRFLQTTLLVGRPQGVAALHQQLLREAQYGYRVVGCCLPTAGTDTFDGVPVLGGPRDVVDVVRRYEVDTVAVLPSPELDGDALRRLGWDLETTRADLLLAPAATEIAGPRVRIRPVCGLSLLQMERPELRGVRRVAKTAFDRIGAGVGLLLLVPVLLTVALMVKVTSRGPILFRQERVGRDGRIFAMIKFRSMEADAELLLERLTAANEGNGVLFKLRHDPRVTRVGRTLRRYSLDELPQLFNVLKGDMSLVGPRPPLPSEVGRFEADMHRRFVVKPGLTGLWQVSGRSNLSWDDSMRMDIHYVENWSLLLDLMILWRTVGAVLRGDGAY